MAFLQAQWWCAAPSVRSSHLGSSKITILWVRLYGKLQCFNGYSLQRVVLKDRTPSEISWIGSFQVFMLFAMGLVSGQLFDTGYFHHLLISGTPILIFSLVLTLFKHYI